MTRALILILAVAAAAAIVAFAAGWFDPTGGGGGGSEVPRLRSERRPSRQAPQARSKGEERARTPASTVPEAEADVPRILVLGPSQPPHVEGPPVEPETMVTFPSASPTGAEVVDAVSRVAPLRFLQQADLDALRKLSSPEWDRVSMPLLEVTEVWRAQGFPADPAGRALLVRREDRPEDH
jgi:hypothetical protein